MFAYKNTFIIILAIVLVLGGIAYWGASPTNRLQAANTADSQSADQAAIAPTQSPEQPLKQSPEKSPAKPAQQPQTSVSEKKAHFFKLIVPAVNTVYDQLNKQYQDTELAIQSDPDSEALSQLRKKYRVQNNQQLLIALKPSPRSIAIAQAAIESAWATSRFFREANNVFGVWSFNKNEPRIAAGKQRGDKTIWLKKYPSVEASIRDYYLTLARGGPFKDFRARKMQTDDPFELVKQLHNYSEKGDVYGKELASIIRFNNLTQYDK